jgi:hypothetical protein
LRDGISSLQRDVAKGFSIRVALTTNHRTFLLSRE